MASRELNSVRPFSYLINSLNRPHMICNLRFRAWNDAQCLMNAAKIVVSKVKCCRCFQVSDALGDALVGLVSLSSAFLQLNFVSSQMPGEPGELVEAVNLLVP